MISRSVDTGIYIQQWLVCLRGEFACHWACATDIVQQDIDVTPRAWISNSKKAVLLFNLVREADGSFWERPNHAYFIDVGDDP